MQSLRPSRAWLACALLTALLLATVAATARSGNEFTGYYDFSGVQEQGDSVTVTLHLRLMNRGDSDLKGVIVTLLDSSPAMTLRGNFKPVKLWRKEQFVEMSQEFTVSQREFQEWSASPAQPNLVILYQDSKGHSLQKGAQMSRRLLP